MQLLLSGAAAARQACAYTWGVAPTPLALGRRPTHPPTRLPASSPPIHFPPASPQAPWVGPEHTFKVVVDTFGSKLTMDDQLDLIEKLEFLPFKVCVCVSEGVCVGRGRDGGCVCAWASVCVTVCQESKRGKGRHNAGENASKQPAVMCMCVSEGEVSETRR